MGQGSRILAGFVIALATSAAAAAGPIVPTFTTFGPLPDATFGGSGIPNDRVAITTIANAGNTITLGLTATERFANPAVGDNGAGVFTAPIGGDSPVTLARWNFDFYTKATGGVYSYDLLYDFDPAAGTDEATLGRIRYAGNYQDSWNLGFAFLDVPSPPSVTPPGFPSFSPLAPGEYSFALIARDVAGVELGRAAINVNAVPEPGSLLLLGTSLVGLALRRRVA